MRLENPMLISIEETRRALTRLEFSAMEITDQRQEALLTNWLAGIKRQTESAAKTFAAN